MGAHICTYTYVYIEDVDDDDDDDVMMWLMDWTERRCELKKGYVVGVSRRKTIQEDEYNK